VIIYIKLLLLFVRIKKLKICKQFF